MVAVYESVLSILERNEVKYFNVEYNNADYFTFCISGQHMFSELPPTFYEIADKFKMRRMRNNFGFISNEFRLSAWNGQYGDGENFTKIGFERRSDALQRYSPK